MPLHLAEYERRASEAVRSFWRNDEKNIDGFIALIMALVEANGLPQATVCHRRAVLATPGYFRPTKRWDLLVIHQNRLVAAIAMKSHLGPSFGKTFNNRTGEAISTSHGFWTAYREEAFGKQPKPFVAWMMLVEDRPESRSLTKGRGQLFPIVSASEGASYLQRYDQFCQRLIQERRYTTATLLTSPRTAAATGEYSELSPMTSLKTFVTSFAGHIAIEAARN